MKLLFKESFIRDLERIKDKRLLARIKRTIEAVDKASALDAVPHVQKLHGPGNYFRIRIGQYRIGLIAEKGEVVFVRCLHRQDVYRYFP
jgi:mRNA interferase RelE/StbE